MATNNWDSFLTRMSNNLGGIDQSTKDALNKLADTQKSAFTAALDEIDNSRGLLADSANQALTSWNNQLQGIRYNVAQSSGTRNVVGGLVGLTSANSMQNSVLSENQRLGQVRQNEESLNQQETQLYANAVKSVGGTSA